MTPPLPDPNAATPEGYDQPASTPNLGRPVPTEPQPQTQQPQPSAQPYAGQQPGYPAAPAQPYAGQQPGYPAGPGQPYAGQQPGYPAGPAQPYAGQQPGYPAGPQPYAGQQQYPAAPGQPHYQAQPPMPNPGYGYAQPKSKVVAGLLGIFLGPLGIHRFYLGFTKIAVIQLLLTIVLGVFTAGLIGLWGVIEGIMILAGAAPFRTDAQGNPLRD